MGSAASAKSFTRVVPADEPKQPQQPAERRVSDQSRTQTLGAAAATRTWTSATASKAARGVVVEGVEIPFQAKWEGFGLIEVERVNVPEGCRIRHFIQK